MQILLIWLITLFAIYRKGTDLYVKCWAWYCQIQKIWLYFCNRLVTGYLK